MTVGGSFPSFGSGLEDLLHLEDHLQVAQAQSHLDSLPIRKGEALEDQAAAESEIRAIGVLRLKALHQRLSDLGYRPSLSQRQTLERQIYYAVRSFQIEIGLILPTESRSLLDSTEVVTNALGLEPPGVPTEKTWQAIQNLVVLGRRVPVEDMLAGDGEPSTVLNRAWQLRLKALGLLVEDFNHVPSAGAVQALQHFWEIAGDLQLREGGPGTHVERISLLLDHPRLIDRLAHASDVIVDRACKQPGFLDHDAVVRHRFVHRLACNELWLLGYDVQPGKDEVQDLALRQFWADAPSSSPRPAHDNQLDRAFFLALKLAHERPPLDPAHLAGFIEQNHEHLAGFWEKLQETTSFLWDGLKRGLTWLGAQWQNLASLLPQQVIDAIKSGAAWVWNAVRAAYSQATKAFSAARRAASALATSLAELFGAPTLLGGIASRLQGNFDCVLVVTAATTEEDRTALSVHYERRIHLLRVTTSTIRLVFFAVRAAVTGFGWLSFVAALVRDAIELTELGAELLELES